MDTAKLINWVRNIMLLVLSFSGLFLIYIHKSWIYIVVGIIFLLAGIALLVIYNFFYEEIQSFRSGSKNQK